MFKVIPTLRKQVNTKKRVAVRVMAARFFILLECGRLVRFTLLIRLLCQSKFAFDGVHVVEFFPSEKFYGLCGF